MLTNIINSHPSATCFFEPFHIDESSIPFGVEGYERISKSARALLLRKQQPATFTNEYIWNHWHSRRTKAVGFKLLYTQARLDSWWKSGEFEYWWKRCGFPPIYGSESNSLWKYLQEDQTVKIIHLTRKNKLKAVLSAKTAIQTSAWGDGASGGFKTSDGLKLYIDPKEVLLTIKENSRFESIISDLFAPERTLHITYEKLSEQTEKTQQEIWDFLSIDQVTMPTKTRKLRTSRLEESISNSKELKELFPNYFVD